MNLLLLSNSSSSDGYLVHARDAIKELAGPTKRAAFVPYAGMPDFWDAYEEKVAEALGAAGIAIASVHRAVDPVDAIADAPLIMVGGGNTFHLLHHCRRTGVLAAIAHRALAGVPYLGWSAGSNLACPTIRTTNDMPVIDSQGLDALDLVPFQINPHFIDGKPAGHFGETRTERLAEFTTLNPSIAVLALPEGSWVRVADGAMTLGGLPGAWWIREGRELERVEPGPMTSRI